MKSFNIEWENIHQSQEWGKYPPESIVRFIARNYYKEIRENIKILDFGCGGGAVTWYLAREGFDVYAFDGSESAVKKAKLYLENNGYNNVKFQVADALEVQYNNEFFDCIIDNVCIYANTFNNIVQMYSKTYNLLKRGGKIFTTSFGIETDGYGTGDQIEYGTYKNIEKGVLKDRAIAHFWKKEELKSVLREIGYLDIHIDRMEYTDRGVKVEMFIVQAKK